MELLLMQTPCPPKKSSSGTLSEIDFMDLDETDAFIEIVTCILLNKARISGLSLTLDVSPLQSGTREFFWLERKNIKTSLPKALHFLKQDPQVFPSAVIQPWDGAEWLGAKPPTQGYIDTCVNFSACTGVYSMVSAHIYGAITANFTGKFAKMTAEPHVITMAKEIQERFGFTEYAPDIKNIFPDTEKDLMNYLTSNCYEDNRGINRYVGNTKALAVAMGEYFSDLHNKYVLIAKRPA
jgi:hypothetical protein